MAEYLFVYGLLRENVDHPMARFLSKNARRLGPATTNGSLYLVDKTYPALTLEGNQVIRGEVFEIDHPENVFPELDRFEGIDKDHSEGARYRREKCAVHLDEEKKIDAWLYLWNRSTKGLSPIPSGDFIAHMASSRNLI